MTGFSEIRGSCCELQWLLNEAPKLEKQVLKAIKLGALPPVDLFDRPLQRLVAGSFFDPVKLRYLRQLLLFCYKAYVTHEQQTTDRKVREYFSTNSQVGEFWKAPMGGNHRVRNLARQTIQQTLSACRFKEIIPGHGPGAVTNSKDRWSNWYNTIETIYPYSDYHCLFFNEEHCASLDDCETMDIIEAKLHAVPKDSRGPRLICIHPSEAMWIQQGVRKEFERIIMRGTSPLRMSPRGHIRFDDQTVNGRIALLSSKSGRYATIDLSEASDRLSDVLVQELFGSYYKYFGCCRAQKVLYQRGNVNYRADIHAYAPMGNATVFPVQSLVFWAICVASMQCHGFHQPKAAFVFGDDIIVPSECAQFVCDDLEALGLRINTEKSYWSGSFRESCGVDAYNGIDVTPVRWKAPLDAESLVDLQSICDTAKRLRLAGYVSAADEAYAYIRRLLASRNLDLPYSCNKDESGIYELAVRTSDVWKNAYWHSDTQTWRSRIHRLKIVERKRSTYDWNHVLESILANTRMSPGLLTGSGRSSVPTRDVSRQVRLARGWTRLY
jgi:hypothetical protein